MVCGRKEVSDGASQGCESSRRAHVVVGSSLASGEDGVVDALLNVRLLGLVEEDESSTGSTEGLVAVVSGDTSQLSLSAEVVKLEKRTWWCRRHRST